MGIQTLIVFLGLVVALAIGTLVGVGEWTARTAGWLAVGLVPVAWTVVYAIEQMMGRDIGHYDAAYAERRLEIGDDTSHSDAQDHDLAEGTLEEILMAA